MFNRDLTGPVDPANDEVSFTFTTEEIIEILRKHLEARGRRVPAGEATFRASLPHSADVDVRVYANGKLDVETVRGIFSVADPDSGFIAIADGSVEYEDGGLLPGVYVGSWGYGKINIDQGYTEPMYVLTIKPGWIVTIDQKV